MIEETLTQRLEYFVNLVNPDRHTPNSVIKERLDVVRNMDIIIFSRDHDPPHFHVRSRDRSIDAKFEIKSCKFIGGIIGTKDRKRIELWYNDVKSQVMLKHIWEKRYQSGPTDKWESGFKGSGTD